MTNKKMHSRFEEVELLNQRAKDKLLSRFTDEEERQLVKEHLERRAAIFKKYDPIRKPLGGLDGGDPDEERELWEEGKRFYKVWEPFREKRINKTK